MRRPASEPLLATVTHENGSERDPRRLRPPSPLHFYDYGCITLTSRSKLMQHRLGKLGRRAGGRGFFVPGPHFKQGTYGDKLPGAVPLEPDEACSLMQASVARRAPVEPVKRVQPMTNVYQFPLSVRAEVLTPADPEFAALNQSAAKYAFQATPGKGGIVDYVIARVSEFTALHRVWGGAAKRCGFWWTTPKPGQIFPNGDFSLSGLMAASGVCPEWNNASFLETCWAKPGTAFVVGQGNSAVCASGAVLFPPAGMLQVNGDACSASVNCSTCDLSKDLEKCVVSRLSEVAAAIGAAARSCAIFLTREAADVWAFDETHVPRSKKPEPAAMAQTADFHADWHLIRANSSLMPHKFTLTDMDKKIRLAKYAVRGAVPARAAQLSAKLKEGKETLPFERMVFCNIGNPHAVQQKPITFFRQVAASVTEPGLLKAGIYPEDVVKRATEYLGATNGAGTGAYTDSSGLLLVRQQVAEFLLKRDGFPAEPKNIYLTTGASEGVKRAISALIKDERCGMLIPRPQYPLYSAALTMTGGRIVYYDMFEEKGWKTSFEELNQAATDAFTDGTKLRAITVINPGNPVGSVLDREDVAMILKFAAEQKLVVMADEVYQQNVYQEGKAFHSFKKVLRELQQEDSLYKDVQLISFHSTSKGILGECGQRGGFMEYVGFSEAVLTEFTKMAATSLSSNTLGQIFVGLMVKPPQPGRAAH
ncbi:unnamed protein product [Effrenium voratum]|nr:unnamed protein product [Effrenium voratum]